MKRRIFAMAIACAAVACPLCLVSPSVPAAEVLKVGATPVPHADILNFVSADLKAAGVDLRVIEFSDYVQPNVALADGDLDANFFQHIPYLESFARDRGLKIEPLFAVHIEPMGVYSNRVKDLKDLRKGASVAIPNDPTNGGRALAVLASAGIIRLKDGAGVMGTVADVVENPKKIKFRELEAAYLPRTLGDVDAAVINSNFALSVGLNPAKDSIFMEGSDSPYANVVAVRTGDRRASLLRLKEAVLTPRVKEFILEKYKGAVVPAFPAD